MNTHGRSPQPSWRRRQGLVTVVTVLMAVAISLPGTAVAQGQRTYLQRLDLAGQRLEQAQRAEGGDVWGSQGALMLQETLLRLATASGQHTVLQALSLSAGEGGSPVEPSGDGFHGNVMGSQAVQNTTSALCQNHTAAFVVALTERLPWAIQMLDAAGKPLPGVTKGNFAWPGGFKQCQAISAMVPVPLQPELTGKYCTLNVNLGQDPASPLPLVISLGICIPSSCSGLDMTLLVDDVLVSLNVTQNPANVAVACQDPKTEWDARAIVAIVVCSLILVLMVVGTAVDLLLVQMPVWRVQEMSSRSTNSNSLLDEQVPLLLKGGMSTKVPEMATGTVCKVFVAFSVYTNASKLLSTRQAPGSLSCVHGIRFLSMTWVVLGHAFAFSLSNTANLGDYVVEQLKRWTFQVIANATVSVDSFFVLSGLLVTYLSLKEMKKQNGKINWFLFYFHRFWRLMPAYLLVIMVYVGLQPYWVLGLSRLTPAYMLVIMVYVGLQPYWGEGPFWLDAQPDRDSCKTNWWTNLLYINNLVKAKEMCLAQSWYLANDMQFYILSPLIFVPFYYSPLAGYVTSFVFLLVTAIVPGALTMKEGFGPSLLPGQLQGNVTAAGMADYFADYYMKPYNRMGPYVVGMLAGYFLYRTDCRLRINKLVNLSIWAVAAAVGLAVFSDCPSTSNGHPITALYNALVNLSIWAVAAAVALAVLFGLSSASNGHPITLPVSALYNAVSRQAWALSLCWVVIACVTGNGGFVNTLLSWSALVPLSRLTYCIYLLHLMILELYVLNRNATVYLSDINIVMTFLAVLVVSYMAAFLASLAFEAPTMALEKIMFKPRTSQEPKPPVDTHGAS